MPWPVLIMFLLLWGGGPINGLILGLSLRIPIINTFPEAMPAVLTVTFILLSLPYLLKRIQAVDYFFYFVVVSIYAFSYLIFPKNDIVLDHYAYYFLVASVPFYYIGLTFDIEQLIKYVAVISMLGLLVSATSIFILGHVEELTEEAMTMGHKCFPHVMMMILCAFVQKRNKLLYIGFAAIGFLLLIVYANRMSILAVVCFMASCLFLMPAATKRKTKIKRVLALSLVVLAFISVNYLITGLESITSFFGTSTRMIDFINEGDALDSNGRDFLWSQMMHYIGQNPFGVGMGGDRLLIDTWSHNLFLEILLSFGWLFGSLLILLLVYVLYLGFRYSKNNIQRFFLLLLFFSGFFKLQFSGSFLNENYIYFLIGYCIYLYRNRNNISTSTIPVVKNDQGNN